MSTNDGSVSQQSPNKIRWWVMLSGLVGLAVLALLEPGILKVTPVRKVPYSQFQIWLAANKVGDLTINENTITGSHNTAPGVTEQFVTERVDPAIAQVLDRQHITYAAEPKPGILWNIFWWVAPIIFFAVLWRSMMTAGAATMGGSLLPIGRSKAKIYAEKGIKTTFADVAGVDEAKQELAEVVGFLKNPSFYGRLGARVPKGVLLVGPPGTGKTLLARAVAGEACVPFLSITGSEFVEMFVGVGAARVRDLFEQARLQAPAIVFIDELDALGRARGIDNPIGGHDEKEQTLNQLLAEMDGFDQKVGIIVLSATNRPEILDPALLRAGRFDRQVLVDRPDRKGRIDILKVHIKKVRIKSDLDLDGIAGMTTGFTGADLANLVNEAALVATRRGADATALEDFTQAIERIVSGLEKKSRVLRPRERQIVAHHEMGHALVAMALPGNDPVQKVSIIPRGLSALGYTMQRPTEDRFLLRQSELEDRLAVLLGGRAAEALIFDEVSSGAADDLVRATNIARDMVVHFGMNNRLGPVAYDPDSASFLAGHATIWRPHNYSEKTGTAIDEAVRELVANALRRASTILKANQHILSEAAVDLLQHETLGATELAVYGRRLTGAASPAAQAGHG